MTLVLSAVKAGITRLRVKGGASKDVLFDAVNCYVTSARSMSPRGGSTQDAALPPGTKGLTLFKNLLHVFASSNVGAMPAGYTLNILLHPFTPGLSLKRIWKADPFMNQLFIVAEWSDGSITYHWLEDGNAWQPNTVYGLGAVAFPTVVNGMRYTATRTVDADKPWAPNIARTVGEVVEPTTPNGYRYTVIETEGAAPRSGATEPSWPANPGAIVYEDADAQATTVSGGTTDTGGGRYSNPGGNVNLPTPNSPAS